MGALHPMYISHSPDDDGWCRRFASPLHAAGAAVWFADDSIAVGKPPNPADYPVFVAILSPAFLASDALRATVSEANILNVVLDDQHDLQPDVEPERVIVLVVAAPCDVPMTSAAHTRSQPPDAG